jgi:hypothetical protein
VPAEDAGECALQEGKTAKPQLYRKIEKTANCREHAKKAKRRAVLTHSRPRNNIPIPMNLSNTQFVLSPPSFHHIVILSAAKDLLSQVLL